MKALRILYTAVLEMGKTFKCNECGHEHKVSGELTICEWSGCEHPVEDTRTINIARMNPWSKFIAVKLCDKHLTELVIDVGGKLEDTAFKSLPEE